MIAITTISNAIVALLALSALLWQIATRRSVAVSVVGAVAGACISLIFFLEPIHEDLAQVTGMADAGRLLGHISILFAGYAAQMIFVGMEESAKRKRLHRRLLLILAAAITILTTCVMLDPSAQFEPSFTQRPAVAAYMVAFLGFLGAAVVGIALHAHRRVQELDRSSDDGTLSASRSARFLRLGLRILSLLGPVGGTYILAKIVYLGSAVTEVAIPLDERYPRTVLANLSILIAVASVTIPLLGPPIDRAGRTVWAWNTFGRLEPLWRIVATRRTLELPRGWTGLREAQAHLHVRIAEIHDGLWALQQWMPGGRLPGDPPKAAAAIDHALTARRRDGYPTTEIGDPTDRIGTTRTEASWLIQVSNAMTRPASKEHHDQTV